MTDTAAARDDKHNRKEPSVATDWGKELPDETLLNIFSRLPYTALLMVEGTSKKFESLLEVRFHSPPLPRSHRAKDDPLLPSSQDESLQKALFRVPPVKKKLTPAANKILTYHPLLDAVDCVSLDSKSAHIYNKGDGDNYNAYDYAACDEFATQPACDMMLLDVGIGKAIPVSAKDGIKIRRILKALGKFWGTKAPNHIAQRARDCWPDGEINYRKALGESCFWVGWESCLVGNDGTVTLTAKEFE